MSLPFVLILVFAFIVFITFAIFNTISSRKTSVTERLERYTKLSEKAPAALKKVEKEEEEASLFDNLDKAIEKKSFSQKIAAELSKADLPLRVSEFMGFRLLSTSLLALIGFLVSKTLGMIILGGIGSMIPPFYVKHLQKKRQKSFNGQIEDALTLISNSLKSGYSFLQAVEMVARETPDPMAIEFKKVLRETSLGLSLEESLNKLAQRMESDDWDLVVTAVTIQRQTGGNLSEILESISSTIRERIKIKG
ncbi:MAG: secretion system protein, partial [Armatimonadetes bacterium CG07_land_8_20_14_0_80_40_9]